MGTHPIFESDFDCLTDNKTDQDPKLKWSESVIISWPMPTSIKTGKDGSRPGLINQQEKHEEPPPDKLKLRQLHHDQLVDFYDRLFDALRSVTTSAFVPERAFRPPK